MKVIAKSSGYFDINRNKHPVEIKEGQVFEVPEGTKTGRWFVKFEDAKHEPEKPPAKPPAKP